MPIFLTLVSKILPLYVLIALGFVAGKFLQINKETIARLLIYIIAPVVVFNAVFTTPLTLSILSLPILFFGLCCSICLLTYAVTKNLWSDSTKNILAFSAGSANTGYFGLPVAIALFGDEVAGLVVLATLGFILFENSLGFFMAARGHHSVSESLLRLIKLPTLYAFGLALILNFSGLKLGTIYLDFAVLVRGAYTVLGMMLVGLGLASITNFKFDFRFLSVAFLAKFLVWPLVVFGVIALEKTWFSSFGDTIHHIMVLMAIVPMAANTVAYATELKTQPEKVAMGVLLSTLLALVYIPLVVMYLGYFSM